MPAVSARQRRTAGMALACQRGNKRACRGPAAKMARSMNRKQVREFARKTRR
ncbi:MAG: DUF3008 family protein [Candidatus Acidiferrales bacterium]